MDNERSEATVGFRIALFFEAKNELFHQINSESYFTSTSTKHRNIEEKFP
jgi:hypothetical protein